MNSQNLATSIHQRLLNKSQELSENFNRLLSRYVQERLLYRLSKSEHAQTFILKGAMLFVAWTGHLHRPTKDLDLLGYGTDSVEEITSLFRQICNVDVPADGVVFDPDSVQVEDIRDQQLYGGKRVRLIGHLGSARISVHIDVGFGDAVTPGATIKEFPTLLDFPPPMIRLYPPETVVAEKLQAIVALDMQNSRMKDFFDLWQLARSFTFRCDTLSAAISTTFNRRETKLPKEFPTGLSDEFAHNAEKATQWRAFLRRIASDDVELDLDVVINDLREFLGPPLFAAESNESRQETWQDGGPWVGNEY